MRPDGVLQLGRFDRSTGACLLASTDDAILTVAGVILARGLGFGRSIRSAEHGQAARAARNQAAQQVVVVGVAAERQQRVAAELLLGALCGGLVEDGGYGDRDPLLTRSWLTA